MATSKPVILILWGVLALTCTLLPSPGAAQVANIVTEEFFNSAKQAGDSCAGKEFYTYQSFLDAASAFPEFGTTGSSDDMRREVAAFFANVKLETGSLCDVEEKDKSNPYCDPSEQYPCAPGKFYYGRGPLQLTNNHNYIDAGRYLKFDGLNDPEALARDPTLSFKASLWFWTKNSICHSAITSGQGFGATIRAINSMECGPTGTPATVANRVQYYTDFCDQLSVLRGDNLSC